MSHAEGAGKTPVKTDWYKWAAGIGVPLVVALIGLLKFSGGGDQKQAASNLTLITDVTVIENEYQQVTGQPLKDENIKQLIQSAVNLAKAGQNEASRKLFEQVASSVPVPAVYNNIGTLNAEAGNLSASNEAFQQALAKDPSYKPAQQNLEKVARFLKQGHEFEHAVPIQVGAKVAGAIVDQSIADFYQFTMPPGPRDVYQVSVENGSTTLHPHATIFDGNHHQVTDCPSYEPLARMDCPFTALPQSVYYVQVTGRYGCCDSSVGPYSLLVTSLKRADRYEPNDDFPQATTISLGSTVEANIMDSSDHDFYLVKSGGTAGQLTATVENGSTTLHPHLTVFDGNHHQLTDCPSYEPLARVDCSFPALPQAVYYVQVTGLYGCCDSSAGRYKLTVK